VSAGLDPSVISVATDDDMSFVYNSWLRSFRNARACTGLSDALYFRSQSALIKQLVETPGVKVLVARSPADGFFIRGWACGGNGELHYVYVKSGVYRREGIASALIAQLGDVTSFSHAREPGSGWLRRMGLVYDGRLFGSPRCDSERSAQR